jgi:hypothetical protein
MPEFVHDKLKPGRFLKKRLLTGSPKVLNHQANDCADACRGNRDQFSCEKAPPQHQVELRLMKFITFPLKYRSWSLLEALSASLLEALSAGCVVIASDTAPLREVFSSVASTTMAKIASELEASITLRTASASRRSPSPSPRTL